MPELLPPPFRLPVELCRVVGVEQVQLEESVLLRCAVDSPSVTAYNIWLSEGGTAVLRFAARSDAPDEAERVEFFGVNSDAPDENFFASPGRQGGLRVLSPERAQIEARYLETEQPRLRRIQQRLQPRVGVSFSLSYLVMSRREQAREAQLLGLRLAHMQEERQLVVVRSIANLATLDHLAGIFDPATARERALRPVAYDEAA